MRYVLCLAILLGFAGCGGGDDAKTFDKSGFDITFEYPSEMKDAKNIRVARSAGNAARASEGVGYSRKDTIVVQRYDLTRDIDEDDLGLAKSELDRVIGQVSSDAGPGKTGKVGALPSVEYQDFDLSQPKGARTRLIALFDKSTEYLINCQYTPSRREDIEKACDQVLETVKAK